MNARKGQDIDLLGLPTQPEIKAMKELGLQPGAIGYDATQCRQLRAEKADMLTRHMP
ncbi:hypothetical protein FHT03_000240 [Xanthomonas arboricola]|uniref:hypothetical protein n=1 Tax=Xanthomonas cannabis TaxID=1885674 RepID=UPI001614B414|nr:hypothetical protein [Xanthomonas cannabis]MBB3804756.1 hypothetical protein [Xanthomonas cannabis]